MLEIRNLTFGYTKNLIIKDFSLVVKAGERVAIQGKSGSGKSTILRIISGLERVSKGSVWLDGQNMTNIPTFQRNIRYVFQSYALFPHMTVEKNIFYGLKHHERIAHKAFVDKVIQLFNIAHLLKSYPHQLSGGEQQRVAIARSLVTKPKVLLLDEPFSALDAELRASIRQDVLNALSEFNITTILVTHDIEDANAICQRVINLEQISDEMTIKKVSL